MRFPSRYGRSSRPCITNLGMIHMHKDGKKKSEGVRGHTGSALDMVENVSDGNWYGSD